MVQKTKNEIIDMIASTYNSNNRSVAYADGVPTCVYNTPDGRKCAFSMLCKDDEILFEGTPIYALLKHNNDILKPEYAGHEVEFYVMLQTLHDDDDNWNENGLNDKGMAVVQKMKQKWSDEKIGYQFSISGK